MVRLIGEKTTSRTAIPWAEAKPALDQALRLPHKKPGEGAESPLQWKLRYGTSESAGGSLENAALLMEAMLKDLAVRK
jgi:hypothetical protein